MFGDDNLVFSTDYPHGDSKYPHAVEAFDKLPMPDGDQGQDRRRELVGPLQDPARQAHRKLNGMRGAAVPVRGVGGHTLARQAIRTVMR